jgi:hypothetical protein
MQIALFGIDNDALNLTVNLLVLLLVVVWLALVAWTYFDARRRLEDPILVWCAVAASLFPFIGTIVYTILRPPEFIEDRKERDLEIRAAELRVRQLTEQSCPNCGHPVEKSYLRCPECQSRIKNPCPSCEKPIDPRWAMCPYCETPIHHEQPRRRSSERRPRREGRERPQAERDRQPERERPKRSKPSAKSSAPKRGKRPAAEPARRKAGTTSPRRASSASPAKASTPPPDPDATQEHPAPSDGAGGERSRSTPAS